MSASNSNSPKSEANSPDFETQPWEQSDTGKDTKFEGIGSDQSAQAYSGEDEPAGEEVKEDELGEEEQGECGFCLFMKGGGCRDSFIAWENCMEQAEKKKEDLVEMCFEVTVALQKCMAAHADYYEPILRAEKIAEEEAIMELEKEDAASRSSEETPNPEDVEDSVKNNSSSNEK